MEYEAKHAVHLPVLDFLDLEVHLLEMHPGMKLDALVQDLVKRWLARDRERGTLRTNGPALRGFQ